MKEYSIKKYVLERDSISAVARDDTTIGLNKIQNKINQMAADGWIVKDISYIHYDGLHVVVVYEKDIN